MITLAIILALPTVLTRNGYKVKCLRLERVDVCLHAVGSKANHKVSSYWVLQAWVDESYAEYRALTPESCMRLAIKGLIGDDDE